MKCRVSFIDPRGIEHACEVEAESTFEAAGMAIARFRRMPAMDPDDETVNLDPTRPPWTKLTIEYRAPVASHTITRDQFDNWFARPGGSPREAMCRVRVREAFSEAPATK
jgi:hypothetical protein